jgi:hypothetical protein
VAVPITDPPDHGRVPRDQRKFHGLIVQIERGVSHDCSSPRQLFDMKMVPDEFGGTAVNSCVLPSAVDRASRDGCGRSAALDPLACNGFGLGFGTSQRKTCGRSVLRRMREQSLDILGE